MQSVERQLVFWREIWPPFSGSNAGVMSGSGFPSNATLV
jgi:hypothetical protein